MNKHRLMLVRRNLKSCLNIGINNPFVVKLIEASIKDIEKTVKESR